MQVRASVKVTNPDNPRVDQAGVIEAMGGEDTPDAVVVRFDLDKAAEVVPTADLVQLGQN